MTAARRERLRTTVYSLVLLALFLGLWQTLAGAGGKGGKGAGIPGPVAVAETVVHAGQVATRSRAGGVHVVSRAKVDDELAWTRGRLVFESVPLSEVVQQLGRWYDLDIRVDDPAVAGRPVTGSYGDEPVAQVLTLITAAVGARYEWHGRSVTIATAAAAR